MKRASCPNCGYHLVAAWERKRAEAVRGTVSFATRSVKPMADLARVYARRAECTPLSARRAVERMAKAGLLRRTSKGRYIAR